MPARLRRMARLALPADARVAMVAREPSALEDLGVPTLVRFPETAEVSPETGDQPLIEELDRLRSDRLHFLLVPADQLPWFTAHEELKQHVESRCRLVLDEEETGTVFALQDPADMPADGIGRDGLPVPPPEMVRLVVGMFDFENIYEPFVTLSELGAASIRETLSRNDLDIADFDSILDFGCGCGRMMRQWRSLTGTGLHGSDYNPYLVGWCRANLPFAEFTVNGVAPPLDYADGQFDFVYALSVFTHFIEALQVPWAREIARVLRPGGIALVSLSGLRHFQLEGEPDRARFEAGEPVILREERAGTNDVAVFHPEQYVREVLAPQAGFEILAYVLNGQPDMDQDAVLLRRT